MKDENPEMRHFAIKILRKVEAFVENFATNRVAKGWNKVLKKALLLCRRQHLPLLSQSSLLQADDKIMSSNSTLLSRDIGDISCC